MTDVEFLSVAKSMGVLLIRRPPEQAHVHAKLKELKANMAKRAGNSDDVDMDMETTPT